MHDYKEDNATPETDIDLSWLDDDVRRHVKRIARELGVPGKVLVNILLRSAFEHQKIFERSQTEIRRGQKQKKSASSKNAISIGSFNMFLAFMFLMGIVLAVLYVLYWK